MNVPKQIPCSCKQNASINYSMIHQFTAVNLYRFFCLSLFRDKYYNVRITKKILAQATGETESVLKDFNDTFRDLLEIKPYYVENSFCFMTRRNIYHIPPMDYPQCITLSRKLVRYELEAKVKGYFIQLLLLFKFGNIEMTSTKIKKILNIDKSTFDKYNLKLLMAGLLKYEKKYIRLVEGDLLRPNDYNNQKYISTNSMPKTILPNFVLNGKSLV